MVFFHKPLTEKEVRWKKELYLAKERALHKDDPPFVPKNLTDEDALPFRERLGLAYCRVSKFGADDIRVGDKVIHLEGLDAMINLRRFLGDADASWAIWRFEYGKSYEEWLAWFLSWEN